MTKYHSNIDNYINVLTINFCYADSTGDNKTTDKITINGECNVNAINPIRYAIAMGA